MNLFSRKAQLIKYVCEELSYAKIVYGISQRKFGLFFGLPFIILYTISLLFCIYSFFSLKASTSFNLILYLILANCIWFQCAIILRAQKQKKWLKRYSNGGNLKFSDALFMYRMEKIRTKIQELGFSEKEIDLIIPDLNSDRNEAIFKVGLFFALIGGVIALSNDSFKVVLGAYLGTCDQLVISICHIGFLLLITPFVYLFMIDLYKLEYGTLPLKKALRNILLEIRLK